MNLLIQVFGCEMAVNSTCMDQPQRMTSLLDEEGFSGQQSHLSRMNAIEYHCSGHRDMLNSQEPCCDIHHASAYIARIGDGWTPAASVIADAMGLHEHTDLQHTVVWPHNPGHAVDDVMLTKCILRIGCCSSLSVTILVHELACEVYPHS